MKTTPRYYKAVKHAPMTANDHILHLLVTVFTGGLWAPVWLYLAWRSNVTYGSLGSLPPEPQRPARPRWPYTGPDGHDDRPAA